MYIFFFLGKTVISYITSSHATKVIVRINLRAMSMKKDGIEVRIGDSAFYFKLGNLLANKKISKNKLSQDTGTDYKVVTRYINGEIERPDLIVLERFCNYLNCELKDIIELRKNVFK